MLLYEGLTPSRVCLTKLVTSAHLRILSANKRKHSSARVYAMEPQQEGCINFQRMYPLFSLQFTSIYISIKETERAGRPPGPANCVERMGVQSKLPNGAVSVPQSESGRAREASPADYRNHDFMCHLRHAYCEPLCLSFPTSKIEIRIAPTRRIAWKMK